MVKNEESIVPDPVKEMLRLESLWNDSDEFLLHWADILQGKDSYSKWLDISQGMKAEKTYSGCPAKHYYGDLWLSDEAAKILIAAFEKARFYLDDEKTREWFANQLREVVRKRKEIEKEYPDLIHEVRDILWKYNHRDYYKRAIPVIEVKCARCGRETNLLDRHNDPYECPVCREFYCFECMNRVDVSTAGMGYTNGKSHWYHLKPTCVNCLKREFAAVVGKLSSMEIEQHY